MCSFFFTAEKGMSRIRCKKTMKANMMNVRTLIHTMQRCCSFLPGRRQKSGRTFTADMTDLLNKQGNGKDDGGLALSCLSS